MEGRAARAEDSVPAALSQASVLVPSSGRTEAKWPLAHPVPRPYI